MTLPESGWRGHGKPDFLCDAQAAVNALQTSAALMRCASYALADRMLTQAHHGPVLFAEFALLRGSPHGREALEREVTSALAYIREVTR